ncbi:MAG: hypothetical protein H5T83_02200 [Actinotalea sp.]|nr:hypothetical protein [Actinotalea sp.]
MMIDCDGCAVRGDACSDCVVTFLTIPVRSRGPVDLDPAERDAIAVLAGSGLVPPLRLARAQ